MGKKLQTNNHVQKNLFIISIIFLFIFLLFIRTWKLTTAPPNVTGDEITYLNDVLRIFHSNYSLNPFSLMGDKSMSGINFYFMAFIINFFPE